MEEATPATQIQHQLKTSKTLINNILFEKLRLDNIKQIFMQSHFTNFGSIFRVKALLGVGAFGVVLEVENLITKTNSALKVLINNK
jgi:hypothetical protein